MLIWFVINACQMRLMIVVQIIALTAERGWMRMPLTLEELLEILEEIRGTPFDKQPEEKDEEQKDIRGDMSSLRKDIH